MQTGLRVVGNLLVMVLLSVSLSALALDTRIPDKVYARTKTGIIRSINMENHTAVISGFKYEFGAINEGWVAEVKMYGSEYGSFEMLKVGMKVRVVYGELNFTRVVVRLQQLADDAYIEEL
jgi:hypothetical protein